MKNPYLLPDNYIYVLKRLEATERRLRNDPVWMNTYSSQINDMVKRGVSRKLSEEEIKTYTGPVHYIAHHAVSKPDSETTPVRIVFDSSHTFQGHSLNSFLAKGPDAFMNNLLTVWLRFRENLVGIVGDIRKMYNSVYIKELEQHVHRFLWRNLQATKQPDIYVITAVNIGDRPSGTIATVALRKTADANKDVYPRAADIIINSTYVDDIIDSVESISEARDITEDITKLLHSGNFHIKGWSISGESQSSSVDICDQGLKKVLGIS